MTRIAILGPGLLGGSIALAMDSLPGVETRLWGRRAEVLEEAARRGVGSFRSTCLCEVVEGADVVVACVPVGVMEGVIREALPALGGGTLVTDVGSVKGKVVRTLAPLLEGKALFVGSHPMAGSEKTGLEAARADLFRGAVCIVTPEEATPREAVSRASLFWEKLGCRVRELAPDVHDQVCARISHVPHVAAAALVNAVAQGCPEAFGFSGPGFRDTTRVAGGAPSMWTEILMSNRDAVSLGLRAVVDQLEQVITLLEQNEGSVSAPLDAFLTVAKQRRDQLRLS